MRRWMRGERTYQGPHRQTTRLARVSDIRVEEVTEFLEYPLIGAKDGAFGGTVLFLLGLRGLPQQLQGVPAVLVRWFVPPFRHHLGTITNLYATVALGRSIFFSTGQ